MAIFRGVGAIAEIHKVFYNTKHFQRETLRSKLSLMTWRAPLRRLACLAPTELCTPPAPSVAPAGPEAGLSALSRVLDRETRPRVPQSRGGRRCPEAGLSRGGPETGLSPCPEAGLPPAPLRR